MTTRELRDTEPPPHANGHGFGDPVVEIVVPAYNEQRGLEPSVRRLRRYLDDSFPVAARLTIVDNGSTDATPEIAGRLAATMPGVGAIRLAQSGRGRAIRAAWSSSPCPVVAYMDADLSTGLQALLPLVAPLLSGHSDLAIGSRLRRGSQVVRSTKRELISRSYNMILRASLAVGFSDAQCGFKAARSDVVRTLLPDVEDQGWFFDTELLVLAERRGFRIHEVSVDWVEDLDSKVVLARTAIEDLKGVWRVRRSLNRPFEHRAAVDPVPRRGSSHISSTWRTVATPTGPVE
ncbi:MAG TPA: dolichyl-phosphate beta-glucosyltransferase [Acidimicrobiales bacterium]|nr:dolichyl-phosphate beta-glucosyltransferase [Acidimicrobiales bacterium]